MQRRPRPRTGSDRQRCRYSPLPAPTGIITFSASGLHGGWTLALPVHCCPLLRTFALPFSPQKIPNGDSADFLARFFFSNLKDRPPVAADEIDPKPEMSAVAAVEASADVAEVAEGSAAAETVVEVAEITKASAATEPAVEAEWLDEDIRRDKRGKGGYRVTFASSLRIPGNLSRRFACIDYGEAGARQNAKAWHSFILEENALLASKTISQLQDGNRASIVGSSFSGPLSFFPSTFLGPLVLKCHLIQAPQLFPGRLPLHATFHSLLPIPRPVYIRPPCSCALLLYSPFSFSVHVPVSIFFALALPFRPAWSSHSMACRFSSFPAVSHPFACVPSCLADCLLAVHAFPLAHVSRLFPRWPGRPSL